MNERYVFFSVMGIIIALVMEWIGFPPTWSHFMTPSIWWILKRGTLCFSLSHFCASSPPSGSGRSSSWIAALDRLCFGVCVVHIRVVEYIFGYVRPDMREFSWDTAFLDWIFVVSMSF